MSYGTVPGQPGGYGGPGGYGSPAGYGGPPPNNYLAWAILATLFCCVPFGVVSIVFAAQVDSKWAAGDFQGAMDSSRKARTWAISSAAVGAAAAIIFLVIFALFAAQQST